ncbi:MAG: archease [Methanomicrobia archaeon]|nr:archease [Methanomicrobia archaeon]MCK4433550.1 archease [Methanomicrobia archaeon]MCK4636275.1 archease [Methanomicrobia archaeon]
MDYELLEHEADIGIRGYGNTIEEAFETGARAMFSIMIDLETVKSEKNVKIKCEAPDIEALFVEWLNELLTKKDLEEMSFSRFEVKIYKDDIYRLEGTASGERFDQKKHKPKLEVKGATYSGLKIGKKDEKIFIQCIVDV